MEYSVVKHVVARQIQYTYTVLLFRFGGEGKTQNQSHSRHPELSQLHQVFTLLGKRQPQFTLGTLRQKPGCSLLATKSSTPKYYLEVAVRFCYLVTTSKSLFKTKWQFGIVQFLGVLCISVSLLSTGTMLQHIIPLAYGSVELSVVHFHHIPQHAYSLRRNHHPYSWRSLLHPTVWNIKKAWSHFLIMPLLRWQRWWKNPQVLRHCVRLICHDPGKNKTAVLCKVVQVVAVPWEMIFHKRLH